MELEVVHLEQYLLSLYRKAFEVKVQEQACVSKVLNEHDVSPHPHTQSHHHQLEVPKTAKRYLSYQLETPKAATKKSRAKSGSLLYKNAKASAYHDSFNESKVEYKEPGKRRLSISHSQPITLTRKVVIVEFQSSFFLWLFITS